MLSILIPTYDEDVVHLVHDLHQQAASLNSEVEILISDQCTEGVHAKDNHRLNDLAGVNYFKWTERKGRAANRNHLAQCARGDFLLFLDSDAEIIRDDFLATYWSRHQEGKVVCASVYYPEVDPGDSMRLHWTYGRKREMVGTGKPARGSTPFKSFTFLISRPDFLRVQFDERLTEYGHEDTIFGKQLRYAFIGVEHIDLPLKHNGLLRAGKFLENTRSALRNLDKLCTLGMVDEDIRLYRSQQFLARAKADWILGKLFPLLEPLLRVNLLSKRPSLRVMDYYKLGYFCSLRNGRKTDAKTLRS